MRLFKKEKRVVQLVLQHIETTASCVQETSDRLKVYVSGDRMESWADDSHVYRLESEADTILREIRELLYSGAYLPLIRGDLYRLMSTIDGVSNKAEACFGFFHNQIPDIPKEYRAEFNLALDLTVECFEELKKALEIYFAPKDKLDKLKKRTEAVGKLESRIDEVEREVTSSIFKSSLDLSQKIHLRHAIRRISDISDSTENAADELELVSLKSVL